MNAEIITIGSEILYGDVVDTNSAYIGQQLAGLGIRVDYITSIPDTDRKIREALEIAFQRARIILVTGGLGPTDDDITRNAIAGFFNRELVFDQATYKRIQRQFKLRHFPMTPTNRVQAYVPRGAQVMPNRVGNAAGFIVARRRRYCFVMPGVPREMKGMLDREAVPFIKKHFNPEQILHRTLHTTGIGESTLFDRVCRADLPRKVQVSYRPMYTGTDIRLTVGRRKFRAALKQAEKKVRQAAGEFIYGADQESLEQVIGSLLKKKKLTLAVAESCTGGLVGDRITNVPGSSGYFKLGVVAYSNQAKTRLLQVPARTIRAHGAVSEETARAMAVGVRKTAPADIGIATTGIAGPGGGTKEKPVGLVCLALAAGGRIRITKTVQARGDRRTVKIRFAQAALNLLYQYLSGRTL